jgi:hypothetical protein
MFDVRDDQAVVKEIKMTVGLMKPGFDFSHFDAAFHDVKRLFLGQYEGYRKCNTQYHDFGHTLMVLLAMTRLMHGACLQEIKLTDKEINLGLISSLMHDAGYIQSIDDCEGTGAKYTLTHITRSIEFVQNYYSRDPYFAADMHNFHDILRCTGLNTAIADLTFESERIVLLGKMLGTADLLGQMADRLYLEKLILLYGEFQEGGVAGYESEMELFRKTVHFFQWIKTRFENEFGNVERYMVDHFKNRWNINGNVYEESIEANFRYLQLILKSNQKDIRSALRRKVFSFH